MEWIAYCLLLLPIAPIDYPAYDGPTYVSRSSKPLTPIQSLKRELLIVCVHAGMIPRDINRIFGAPSVFQDDAGPVTCSYWDLGATVFYPMCLYNSGSSGSGVLSPERVLGGIQ